ncbi:MAG: biotin--[acetyl-CoA-carboxylase] ligase [Paludibacteraceae bacterium]|nr:biotin--[acetyl-CoA-carboxylase] ligase [Paludibacteraceae bacterium]
MTQQFIHLKETDSTNSWLQSYARQNDPNEGLLVFTDFQTSGRGQMGNHWESAPGANLLFTLLLKPANLPANAQFVLSQAVALGVVDYLSTFGADFSIKWPNDIYWNNKKIAGILIENDLDGNHVGRSYIGIGLNINQLEFVSDAPNPVSLAQIIGRQLPLGDCLDGVYQAILDRYARLSQADRIRCDYKDKLYRFGQPARYRDANGLFTGTIEGVADSGHLLVRHPDGTLHHYFFKEIEFVIG